MSDMTGWTPRPFTGPVELSGRFVRVVPCLPQRHGDRLWEAFGGAQTNDLLRYFPNPPFADAGDLTRWLNDAPGRGWQVNAFLDLHTDAPIGMASFMRTDAANGVTEIGAVAHGRAMARTPAATEAHFLLARHVFETLGYRRYEWKLDDRNAPSHAAARRLGFAFEGVFRNHLVVKGENRDTAWYAMIDRDWPRVRAALDAWLAPENLDGGRQRRRLEDIRAAGLPGAAAQSRDDER